MISPEDKRWQRLAELQNASADARRALNLKKAELYLAQAQHRLSLKAKANAAGERISSGDLDAEVDKATYSTEGPLYKWWFAVTEAEAAKDVSRIVMKSLERELYGR